MGRELKVGDYVLATKYSDGDPGDQYAVGIYAGPLPESLPAGCQTRHLVNDGEGKPFRANGFRRVAKISARGAWLIANFNRFENAWRWHRRSVWWWYRAPMKGPHLVMGQEGRQ